MGPASVSMSDKKSLSSGELRQSSISMSWSNKNAKVSQAISELQKRKTKRDETYVPNRGNNSKASLVTTEDFVRSSRSAYNVNKSKYDGIGSQGSCSKKKDLDNAESKQGCGLRQADAQEQKPQTIYERLMQLQDDWEDRVEKMRHVKISLETDSTESSPRRERDGSTPDGRVTDQDVYRFRLTALKKSHNAREKQKQVQNEKISAESSPSLDKRSKLFEYRTAAAAASRDKPKSPWKSQEESAMSVYDRLYRNTCMKKEELEGGDEDVVFDADADPEDEKGHQEPRSHKNPESNKKSTRLVTTGII